MQNSGTITVDEKIYSIDDLTKRQAHLVIQMQNVDAQLNKLAGEMEVLQFGRNGLLTELKSSLKAPPPSQNAPTKKAAKRGRPKK